MICNQSTESTGRAIVIESLCVVNIKEGGNDIFLPLF